VRHYWLVALFALGAFVLLVLIVYTWPRPPLPEAEAQRVGTLRASPQVVSAETTASVPAAAADTSASRVEGS
jgi:multidrug efflux pump subunit AcrB